jgi:hypothetical protein
MTESLFDPTGPETEHSGSRNLGPDPADASHMPPDLTDGIPEDRQADAPDQDEQTEQIEQAEEDRNRTR